MRFEYSRGFLGCQAICRRIGSPTTCTLSITPANACSLILQCCKRKGLPFGYNAKPSNVRLSLYYYDYLSPLPAVEGAREQ